MNIVSTMVGLSIAGVASPMLMDMSLSPVIAQKKAQNFGLAESAAVLYVAQNRTKTDPANLAATPAGCTRSGQGVAINITCSFGVNKLRQTVTRSFVLPPVGSGNTEFPMERPEGDYISWLPCPNDPSSLWYDPWGVNGYNDQFAHPGQLCTPGPAQGGLDPNDDMSTWLWDLRGQGFG